MSDPRIDTGLARQLEDRRLLLAEGRSPLGWKAGFGAPSALEGLRLDGPLVGFLTDASIVEDGAVVDVTGWSRPVAEPELAVRIGEDLEGGADEERVRSAISGVGPAIELADVNPPPEDVTEILASNIFHRGVILGESRPGASLEGLDPRIVLDGKPVETLPSLEDLTGRITAVVSHLSRLLADYGETIRRDEVVICGSVVPPLPLGSGTHVEFELRPFPAIAVSIA